jgi:hypothetical protein
MSGATLIFEIHQNGMPARTLELGQDIIKIGKLASSHLRLDDPHVSRIHAVIEQSKDGSVHIIDLGSSRGTVVNGQKVNKWKLSSGDEIQLGSTKIVMSMAAAVAAPQPDPDATHVDMMGAVAGGQEVTHVTTKAAVQAQPVAAQVQQTPQAKQAAQPVAQTPAASPLQVAAAESQQQVYAAASDVPYSGGAAQAGGASGVSTQGWYDDQGNWHDGQGGYYDPEGNYHDDQGGWFGPDGNYHDDEGHVYDSEGNYLFTEEEVVSDVEVYSEAFLHTTYDSSGTGILEVAFLYNDHVLTVNQYRKPEDIFIGEAPKNTLQMKHASIPAPRFPLIKVQGGDPTLNFTDKMEGVFHIGDDEMSLAEIIGSGRAQVGGYGQGTYSLSLTPQTRARLSLGNSTILVHHTAPAKVVGAGDLGLDASFAGNVFISTLLHAIFMFLVFFIPPGADDFQLDSFDVNNRFVSQIVKPEEPKPEEDLNKNKEKEAEGAKAKEEEGKAGKKDSKQKDRKMAVKGPKDNKELKIAKDREKAYNTGALDVLSRNQLTADWSSGNQTLGMAAITALGNNQGDKVGEASGVGAFGNTGAGRGGGGISDRGFGQGGFGTAGSGGGSGGGSDYGRGAGAIQERKALIPKVRPGAPSITGSLDRKIIQRVIRKHTREVKYCYEQQLQKNKNLAGRVIINFTISGTGGVVAASAGGGTLGNSAVSSCIASKVRRWVFPEPNGGGIVRVSYPFLFSANQ